MAQLAVRLDGVFNALSDPTRRSVVHQLGRGPASVSDLARSASMTLPSFMKHIATLEHSGLIGTSKSGRVRTCSLNRAQLAIVDTWLDEQRTIWEQRTDRLERFVTSQQQDKA